jgi:hypothetical protein
MNATTDHLIRQYEKYHYKESINKIQHVSNCSAWLKSKVDDQEWCLFTCTVLFKVIDNYNTKDRFEQEYKNKVLQKIRRRLERSQKYQPSTIVMEHIFYFEKNEKSLRKLDSKKCPFHIHALLPIRKNQVHRFWSYDNNQLDERLMKDLNSIDIVQNILIEPVKDNDSFPWLMYITKSKFI